VADNEADGQSDADRGITMGLFGYPVLMAADILMFNAHKVPVGRDQTQHIEMARDMAGRFNHIYKGDYFTLPEAIVDEKVEVLRGLDGRKMSKSYDNTIPLFASEKKLLKLVRKIKTNSLEPGEPKDPDTCTLFQIYSAFATEEESLDMRRRYGEGIGWGDAKNEVFEYLNAHLREPRERYEALMNDPGYIEQVLVNGAERARAEANALMEKLRIAVGLGRFQ
jgi:tryptophanyl-tRNA synthetase